MSEKNQNTNCISCDAGVNVGLKQHGQCPNQGCEHPYLIHNTCVHRALEEAQTVDILCTGCNETTTISPASFDYDFQNIAKLRLLCILVLLLFGPFYFILALKYWREDKDYEKFSNTSVLGKMFDSLIADAVCYVLGMAVYTVYKKFKSVWIFVISFSKTKPLRKTIGTSQPVYTMKKRD